MVKRIACVVICVASLAFLAGCTTTNHAAHSKVFVKSNPSGTFIKVHDKEGPDTKVHIKDKKNVTSIKVHAK